MAFVRIKKRKNTKGKEVQYGYIVDNKWSHGRKKGPRQKVKKYLGRVFKFERKGKIDVETRRKGRNELILDVIKAELLGHGFEQASKNALKNGKIEVDLRLRTVSRGKIKACIAMNEGILSGYSMRRLFRFKCKGEEAGYNLAKLLIESGLNVDKPVFVELYQKIKRS